MSCHVRDRNRGIAVWSIGWTGQNIVYSLNDIVLAVI